MNKVIVITGASGGLGKELAKSYLTRGNKLILSGRNKKKLSEFENNPNVDLIIGDLTEINTINEIDELLTKKHKRVDILINNAGILFIQPFIKNTEKQLNSIFEINVKTHIRLTQRIFYIMQKQKFGHIINIISTAGLEPKYNHTLYSSTKYALRGFTESLRLEAKRYNIKVTGVYPGGIKTQIFKKLPIDKKLFMEPAEVAESIYKISELGNVSPDSLVLSRMSSEENSIYSKVK